MVEALAIAWGELQHALAAAVSGGGGNHAGEGRLAVDGGHHIGEGGARIDHDQLLIEYQGPPTGASEAGADGGVLIVHIPLAGAAVARQSQLRHQGIAAALADLHLHRVGAGESHEVGGRARGVKAVSGEQGDQQAAILALSEKIHAVVVVLAKQGEKA